MDQKGFSRRFFLKGAAAAMAGAVAYSTGFGPRLFRPARAAATGEKSAVLLLFLHGGYNALFCSADSFLSAGSFNVTSSNIQRIGTSDLYVDKASFGTMPQNALTHMASIGVRHGLSSHDAARNAIWNMGAKSYPIMLASAMGGDAAIKYASVGDIRPYGANTPINGVSVQTINDLQSALDAMGDGAPDPSEPDRGIAAGALAGANSMSASAQAQNPGSLSSLFEGYGAVVDTLRKPVEAFDFADLKSAYGLGQSTAVKGLPAQLAAAELMIRAGANVVALIQGNPSNVQRWDSHGDSTGNGVRNRMNSMMGALNTWLTRSLSLPNANVVTVIFGDFSRSLPGSNHQPNLTATVIGKYVKLGTTGRVGANVSLPMGTPGIPGFWAYLAAVAKADSQPFGPNPHPLVL